MSVNYPRGPSVIARILVEASKRVGVSRSTYSEGSRRLK